MTTANPCQPSLFDSQAADTIARLSGVGVRSAAIREIMSPGRPDDFQTPPAALGPLLPLLPQHWHVWEPSCGKGNIVKELRGRGYTVTGTDILTGHDFFHTRVTSDAIVTNPPFSCKDDYIARCYDLGRPFALLMPLSALEGKKRQALYRSRGLEVVLMDRRINFETPSGKGGGSWFATAWFTNGLNIGSQLTFAHIAGANTEQSQFDLQDTDQ